MAIDRGQLTSQFEDAVDRLEWCIRACPDDLWTQSLWPVPRTDPWVWPTAGTDPVPERTDESIQRFSAFWCIAYHALWFLDFYATPPDEPFDSPEYVKGGPEELGFAADGAVAVPDRVFPRDPLLRYVAHCRDKVRRTVATVTPEQLAAPCPTDHPREGERFEDVLGVNLEHVREHGGQMERFLERHGVSASADQ